VEGASSHFLLHAQQSSGTAPSLPPITLKQASPHRSFSTPAYLKYSSQRRQRLMPRRDLYPSFSADQPPPRRKYSRPTTTTADQLRRLRNTLHRRRGLHLASRWFPLPHHELHSRQRPPRKLSTNLGVQVEFDWANFAFRPHPESAAAIYNGFNYCQKQSSESIAQVPLLRHSRHRHIWSFTLNPIMNVYTSDTFGAYVTVGGGFLPQTANFTIPNLASIATSSASLSGPNHQSYDKIPPAHASA